MTDVILTPPAEFRDTTATEEFFSFTAEYKNASAVFEPSLDVIPSEAKNSSSSFARIDTHVVVEPNDDNNELQNFTSLANKHSGNEFLNRS